MNANIEMQKKELPALVKMQDTYKIIIPKEVEEKIRYLCRKFPTLEWSGVLFTTHSGSFEDKDLVITCHDIYPMDLGTSTYTNFKMSEDVAAYMAENIELFDCDLQLIHSHNVLSTFFSGTDTTTLREEGNERNCFVSLIVNNAGTYCAAVTRKVKQKTEVITKNMGMNYEFFGEGNVKISGKSEVRNTFDEEVIQYFMLHIEKEEVPNPLAWLDDRFDEIQKKKEESYKSKTANSKEDSDDVKPKSGISMIDDSDFFSWIHNRENQNQQVLFDDEEPSEDYAFIWQPDKKDVQEAVTHMLTCSLILNAEKFDLRQWVAKHMDNIYDKLFNIPSTSGAPALLSWIDFVVEYTIDTFPLDDSLLEGIGIDDIYASIAIALKRELSQYKQFSDHIDEYINALDRYIYN